MIDGTNTPTTVPQNTWQPLLAGETSPLTMLIWFAVLALALHIKSMLWLLQPTHTPKSAPLPIEVTLLPVPLKQAAVEPIKAKPVQEPKKKPPPPKKTVPKPLPKPKAPPKPAPTAQPKPLVRTTPMDKTAVAKPKAVEPIAPVVAPAPLLSKPAMTTPLSTPAKSTSHTSSDSHEPFVEANYRPNYGFNPKPKYPPSAKSRHLEGKVLLTVKVSAEGLSEQVTVEKSSGHEILDNAAVEAVQKWKFVPARRGNKAVACTVTVPISFKLNT